MIYLLIYLVLHTLCTFLSFGLLYPMFRHISEWSAGGEEADYCGSLWLSVGGPFTLPFALVFSEGVKHGLTWRRKSLTTVDSRGLMAS